ncbi:Formyltetrahydrofolate deformylase [Acaromyces ingoldii]|uniref:Formyltetrahydrofolate deformylase n=1 Tax=Acaromyces ingoldii TaxID=215250 RepID=A0A316YRN4_9BASI|nr:Formyltetrahydrofolate deformylase [Acaromyces ingoldii]PWN91666.1 Formyltetrahydrofolate deformylase [Acaromyces ingoldii]
MALRLPRLGRQLFHLKASSAVAPSYRSFSSLLSSNKADSGPAPSGARTLRSLAELESMSSTPQNTAPPARPGQVEDAGSAGQGGAASSSAAAAAPFPSSSRNSFILTLSCPDRQGIVHRVTGFLAQRGFNIRDSAQFGDPTTNRFFMRVHAEANTANAALSNTLQADFTAELGAEMEMSFEIHRDEEKPRTMIMVSKIGHCLNDLLFRVSSGTLPIEVPLIVSNHDEYEALAKAHGIPFFHLPIEKTGSKTKAWQEEEILRLCKEYKIDLVVLARYMQILSPKLCSLMSGRIINIHHSFLPSFKGAKPYHQAYERGIKLIGATAHYVTADLDEGPIIEQAVDRVNHAYAPADLTRAGADIEARVLARAVRWHAERRVLLNGAKTVVFS